MRFPFNVPVEREFDAAGFGVNAVDHLIVVPYYPENDSTTQMVEQRQGAGGQTASAIVALQRLGLRTAYAGRFGSDSEGSFGLQSLKDEGVDVEFAEVIEDAHTQVGYIIIEAKRGERTVIWDRDELLAYVPDDAPVELAATSAIQQSAPRWSSLRSLFLMAAS